VTAAAGQTALDEELEDELAGLEDLVGRELLGRYRLDERLSIGGTGAVYRGHQITLKRDVAVKILHPQLTKNERIFKRFRREAESTARFEHPNIVQVLEAGSSDDGYHFIVMQLLDGVELHEMLGAPFAPRRAAEILLQIFCGLEHAHERGVVHRDLKPENVFITRDHENRETAKLVDFGLAKLLEGAEDGETLTRLGMVFGTPAYMSPEQATGVEVDHRTDLYSAGLILYGMLAGRPPFIEDDPVALMRAQVKELPPPLPDEVPTELAELTFELLAKKPDDRPADATTVRNRLEEMLPKLPDGHRAPRRAIPMWLSVAGVAIVVGVATFGIVAAVAPEDTTDAAAVEAADTAPTPTEPKTTQPEPDEAAEAGPVPGQGPDVDEKPEAPAKAAPEDGAPEEAKEATPKSSGKAAPTAKEKSPKKSSGKREKKKKKKRKRLFNFGEPRKPGGG
jgi:tRNA A-37 threonylcarbamoyl transferase component Bud32